MRRKTILTTAAILAVGATPASAAYSDVQPPPSSMRPRPPRSTRTCARPTRWTPPSTSSAPARSAGTCSSATTARPTRLTPRATCRRCRSRRRWWRAPSPPPASTGATRDIGAAGMLALLSIAAGSALLLTGRKRRNQVRVATH